MNRPGRAEPPVPRPSPNRVDDNLTSTASRWWGFGTLTVAILVTIAACGATDKGADGQSATTAEPAVLAVHEGVRFYPACGNEVLHYEDLTLYMLLREESIEELRLGHGAGIRLLTVAPPEPGEDLGTLTVYSDGYARFVSDNGAFDVWLTSEPRDYNFVC